MSACYKDGEVSYTTCGNSEGTIETEIQQILPRKLDKLPGGLSICLRTSNDTLSTGKPIDFKANSEYEFLAETDKYF